MKVRPSASAAWLMFSLACGFVDGRVASAQSVTPGGSMATAPSAAAAPSVSTPRAAAPNPPRPVPPAAPVVAPTVAPVSATSDVTPTPTAAGSAAPPAANVSAAQTAPSAPALPVATPPAPLALPTTPVAPPAAASVSAPEAPAPTGAPIDVSAPQTPTSQAPAPPIVPSSSSPDAATSKPPSDEQLAAELAQLGVGTNTKPSDAGSVISNLGFYGFADFMFAKSLDTERNSVLWPYDSFSIGNLNLYWGGSLGSNWQTLAEVRFTYLPHGASSFAATGAARTDTTVGDYNDYDRPMRWGGIEIERVWVEYVAHSLLTLRFGQWLTPYGIWNVDHGSPVIIGVTRPFVIGEELFPERQTGLELYGAWQFEKSELSYHLTLSNGRGALDAYKDLDGNKAFGARIQWRSDDDWGRLALGGSLYRGRYTDSTAGFASTDSGGFERTFDTSVQYDETGLALDLKYELEGYVLQGELLVQDKVYTPGNRPQSMAMDGGPPGFLSDERRWGAYGLTGYRTPWFGIMPFLGLEYYASDNAFSNPAVATFLGINARVATAVVLKAQWTHSWFPNLEKTLVPPADNLFLQIAWSF